MESFSRHLGVTLALQIAQRRKRLHLSESSPQAPVNMPGHSHVFRLNKCLQYYATCTMHPPQHLLNNSTSFAVAACKRPDANKRRCMQAAPFPSVLVSRFWHTSISHPTQLCQYVLLRKEHPSSHREFPLSSTRSLLTSLPGRTLLPSNHGRLAVWLRRGPSHQYRAHNTRRLSWYDSRAVALVPQDEGGEEMGRGRVSM